MKKSIFTSKRYTEKILGYTFDITEFPSKYIMITAPMGDTKSDKEMFDDLVYNHNLLYTGETKNKLKIISNIRKFITNYKNKE